MSLCQSNVLLFKNLLHVTWLTCGLGIVAQVDLLMQAGGNFYTSVSTHTCNQNFISVTWLSIIAASTFKCVISVLFI